PSSSASWQTVLDPPASTPRTSIGGDRISLLAPPERIRDLGPRPAVGFHVVEHGELAPLHRPGLRPMCLRFIRIRGVLVDLEGAPAPRRARKHDDVARDQ